ncbi:hypothetical protein ACFXTI_005412 [Malus domestica]
MEQMVSEKQITLRSSSTGPGGPGLPLEDDVVLIVGHFGDSSEQRIRFPSSEDCVCGKENSGRVEDPGEGFARRVNANVAKPGLKNGRKPAFRLAAAIHS